MKTNNPKSLNLLLVSDIHESISYVEKLQKWCNDKTQSFDYVLVSGDTGNVIYEKDQPINQKQQTESQTTMITILKKLQNYNCPILYIPGNHDCLVQFQGKILTQKSYNIHKGFYQLSENLKIKGFGGSVPGYAQGKQVWVGYPFNSESQFQWAFKPLFDEQQKQQFILMSHVGPSKSTTTVDSGHSQVIITGSSTLDQYIERNRECLILNIHGHTHEGTGTVKHKNVRIINPGSLSRGEFAIISLVNKEKWYIEQIQLNNLKCM